VRTFVGVCLKLFQFLYLLFVCDALAAEVAEWPEFNPEHKDTVAFYLMQAEALCTKMEQHQKEYHQHADALASQTESNPFYKYQYNWMPVWRAYSKDPYNREREMGLSLEKFGNTLVAKLQEKRLDLQERAEGNPPFPREMIQSVTVEMQAHFESPVKVQIRPGVFNTWMLPTAIPGTCTESPVKGPPSKRTPPRKNSNMVRMGLGMVPWIEENLEDGEKKYTSANAHHMGQKPTDETIVILNYGIHKTHSGTLHGKVDESMIDRNEFAKERSFMSRVLAARRTRKWLRHLMEQFNTLTPPVLPLVIDDSAVASASAPIFEKKEDPRAKTDNPPVHHRQPFRNLFGGSPATAQHFSERNSVDSLASPASLNVSSSSDNGLSGATPSVSRKRPQSESPTRKNAKRAKKETVKPTEVPETQFLTNL